MPAVKLSGELNVIFVHIPKTAGTSIGRWMIENKKHSEHVEWYKHPKLSDIEKDETDNFVFSVVRNPWDRMVSSYHWLRKIQSPIPDLPSVEIQTILDDMNKKLDWSTFEKWLDVGAEFALWDFWFRPVEPQTSWLDGKVDLILKYENLNNEFRQIQNYFDSPDSLSNMLTGDHRLYREYYNDRTKKKVEKIFEKDIETWKYSF
jgi:chondroitin 4-sulfotransferase 11